MRALDTPTRPARKRIRLPRWMGAAAIVFALAGVGLAGLAALPVLSPGVGASAADALRSIVGPEPVAALESASLQIGDAFNSVRYRLMGGQAQISWAETAGPGQAPSSPMDGLATSGRGMTAPGSRTAQPVARPAPGATSASASPAGRVATAPGVVEALPAIGWEAFGPTPSGSPVMARASVKPDAARPYAQVALVRVDLSQTRLHLVAGTVEPKAAQGVPAFPRSGAIPAEDQLNGRLLAAFNGGFKAVHGAYGMAVDGVTILPPRDGLATLALYRDGSVRMGAWGRDITPTRDLVAYRQNCPLLVDAGQVNPAVNDDNPKEWGFTVRNLDTTWRSGLGITRDGRFLVYAAGPSLTVETLARALQQAGAHEAMQLDINAYFTRFVVFSPAVQSQGRYPVVAQKLLQQMAGTSTQFLAPDQRDFFYLTAAAPAGMTAFELSTKPGASTH